jgi:hypothetical protein
MALMTNNKQKSRTFEIKMVVKVSTEEQIQVMLDMKNDILSGKFQREMLKDGIEKVTITFTETYGGNK